MEIINTIESGSKLITVKWDAVRRLSGTYISTNTEREKIPHETTQGYAQVFEFLQNKATEDGEPLTFQFSTSRETLQKWALDPEKALSLIGDWDNSDKKGNLIILEKIIYPKIR